MAPRLQKQVITIPTGGGIAQNADPRLLNGPLMAHVENAQLNKAGAYEKRRGMEEVSVLELPTDQLGLNSIHDHDQRPLLYGHDGAYAFDEAGGDWHRLIGSTQPVEVARILELHGDVSITCYDSAVGDTVDGNVLVETWLADGVLWVRTLNFDTGAVLYSQAPIPEDLGPVVTPHVMWLDGTTARFYVFYQVADSLQFRIIDPLTGPGAETELIANSIYAFDADVNADNTFGAIGIIDDGDGSADIIVIDWDLVNDGPFGTAASTIAPFAATPAFPEPFEAASIRVYIQGSFVAIAGTETDTGNVNACLFDISTPSAPAIIGERASVLTQPGGFQSTVIGMTTSGLFVGSSAAHPTIFDPGLLLSFRPTIPQARWRLLSDEIALPVLSDEFVTTGCLLSHRCRVVPESGTWFGVDLANGPTDRYFRQSDDAVYVFEPSKPYPAHLFLRIDEDTPGSVFETRPVEGEFEVEDPIEVETRVLSGNLAGGVIPVARVHHDAAVGLGLGEAGLQNPVGWVGSVYFVDGKLVVPSPIASRETLARRSTSSVRFNTAAVTTTKSFVTQGGVLTRLDPLSGSPGESAGLGESLLLNQGGGVLLAGDRGALLEAYLLPGAPRIEWVITSQDVTLDVTGSTSRYCVVVVGRDADGTVVRSAPSNSMACAGPFRRLVMSLPDVTLRRLHQNNEYVAEVYWTGKGLDIDTAILSAGEQIALLPTGPFHLIGETRLVRRVDGLWEADVVDAGLLRIFDHAALWATAAGELDVEVEYEQNAQLYTEGGILEAQPAPPFYAMVAGSDRAYAIDAERRHACWVSTAFAPGEVPRWNAELITGVGPGTDLTALALLDDKVVLFSAQGIFVRSQVQALATGEGLADPVQPVPSDTGCIERTSVVTTPVGVMFRGQRGYYMLDRGLQVRYIGGPVEDQLTIQTGLTEPLVIKAATLVATDHEVRIATEEGYIFVYHYLSDQWSLREGKYKHATTVASRYYSATDVDGWAVTRDQTSDAESFADPNTDPDDATVTNHLRLTTGWIKLNSLQGYGVIWRVLILGETRVHSVTSAPRLRVTLAYDYNETVVDTFEWPDSTTTGFFAAAGPLSLECLPSQDHCEAIKIGIEELPRVMPFGQELLTVDAGPAHVISGVTLEVGLLPGRNPNINPAPT